MRKIIALTLLVETILVASPAVGQTGRHPFVGRWHADFSQSYDPYAPHPKSVTLDIKTDNENIFESVETTITSDGATRVENLKATFDGKFYPIEGSPIHASALVSRESDDTRRIGLITPDGYSSVILCKIAPDALKITCDETDTDRKGVTTKARSVYVREAEGGGAPTH